MTELTYAYVALIDVLGFRTLLARDRNDGVLTFQTHLREALKILSNLNEVNFQYQAISDTIIIICGDKTKFIELAISVQKLIVSFLEQQLLIRGGIAYSQHFHSGQVTYSHALALSYELESRKAIYPRILVDDNIIKLQEEIGVTIPNGILLEQNKTVFIDFIAGIGWQKAYDLARHVYLDQEGVMRGNEAAFSKHLWIQNLLLNHPNVPGNAVPYIERPVALSSLHRKS